MEVGFRKTNRHLYCDRQEIRQRVKQAIIGCVSRVLMRLVLLFRRLRRLRILLRTLLPPGLRLLRCGLLARPS